MLQQWDRATHLNLIAIRFNLVQFWPSALHCGFPVFALCFSMVRDHYQVISMLYLFACNRIAEII